MKKSGARIARTFAHAALVMVLALANLAPSMALAAVGEDKGTITITTVAGNEGMTYNGYKIFTCDVELKANSSTSYVATNITWANQNMATTVSNAIKTYDNTYKGESSAQEAASYMVEMFPETGSHVRVGANGFAENLAKAVDDVSDPDPIELTAGTPKTMDEGFYLIVSKPTAVGGSQVGTGPIFTMLGNGQDLTITEKTSVPTLSKTVCEDPTSGGQSSYADAQVGQGVTFTLTGTLPDSINTFTSFIYQLEDTLPSGMDLVCADGSFAATDVTVRVYVGETAYPVDSASYVASYADKKLTVAFSDLKKATSNGEAIPVDATSKVVVTYKAALNSTATAGTPGSTNSATLTYSNNPQEIGAANVGTSAPATATVYEYGLELYKYDQEDLEDGIKTPLSGAKFTIKVKSADDAASKGKYVQADGSLGDEPYEFTTDSEGHLSVVGLDAGTYAISETGTPEGYKELADLTLIISPSFWAAGDDGLGSNAVGSLKLMTATLSGGNDDTNTKVLDTADGVVCIQVTNEKGDSTGSIELPLTGLPGITLVYVVGGAILVVSLVVLVRRRLKT